jgi:hypothetical protein
LNKVKWQSTLIWTLTVCGLLGLGLMLGCSRTVLVTEGSPVRLGPNTKTKVYTLQNGEWILSDNVVQLDEGWYVVPPSFVTQDKSVTKK